VTAILKRDAHDGAVSALATRSAPAPALQIEDPAVAALKSEIAELNLAFEAEKRAAADAVTAAYEDGYKAAEAAFVHSEASALSALEAGIAEALRNRDEAFSDAEGLGLALCTAALETVFGPSSSYAHRVSDAVRHQVASLQRETLIRVSVSSRDFSNDAALAALAKTLRLPGDAIAIDASLAAGECHIDLRLGELELSLPKHWEHLQSLLREMSGART